MTSKKKWKGFMPLPSAEHVSLHDTFLYTSETLGECTTNISKGIISVLNVYEIVILT